MAAWAESPSYRTVHSWGAVVRIIACYGLRDNMFHDTRNYCDGECNERQD